MSKELPPPPADNSPAASTRLTTRDQIDILLTEYQLLMQHSRMYVEQFTPKFSVFAIFVLSGFGFALQYPQYPIVFAMIPVFILLIGFVTISQVYILTVWAKRLAAIENRIKNLNEGEAILKASSEIAPKSIYTPWVTFRLKFTGTNRIPNPILIAVIFMVLTSVPLIVYSIVKVWSLLPGPWNLVYTGLAAVASIVMVLLSFLSFHRGAGETTTPRSG